MTWCIRQISNFESCGVRVSHSEPKQPNSGKPWKCRYVEYQMGESPLTEPILFLPAKPGRACMNPEQAERRELWHFRRGAFIGVRIIVIFQGDAARCAAISDLGVIPFCLGTKGELDAGLSDTKTTRKSMV